MTAPSLECLLRMAEVLDIDLDPQETNVVDLDDKRHGTEAGRSQHQRDGETPCAPCRDASLKANRRRSKRKLQGQRYTLPLGQAHAVVRRWADAGVSYETIARHVGIAPSQTHRIIHGTRDTEVRAATWLAIMEAAATTPPTPDGIRRRLQALAWLGYSAAHVGRETGLDGVHVARLRDGRIASRGLHVHATIVDAYNRLHMTPATGSAKIIARAKNQATREGWLPPLAWADIDLGTVAETQRVSRLAWFDEVRVVRIIEGDGALAADASRPERLEVIRRWIALGRSAGELERLTGWQHVYRDVDQDAAA